MHTRMKSKCQNTSKLVKLCPKCVWGTWVVGDVDLRDVGQEVQAREQLVPPVGGQTSAGRNFGAGYVSIFPGIAGKSSKSWKSMMFHQHD